MWKLQGHWFVCTYKTQDSEEPWRLIFANRVHECMLLWKPRVAKIVCSVLERHLTDYMQVHTCVFHYLIGLGDWCLSWQIHLLGWQDYKIPERDQMLREKETEHVMRRKHGEAIKPAGKSRLKYGSSLFCWAQVDSCVQVKALQYKFNVLENKVFCQIKYDLVTCSQSEIFNSCLFPWLKLRKKRQLVLKLYIVLSDHSISGLWNFGSSLY